MVDVQTQALRRTLWYCYGSPDHPGSSSKSIITQQKSRLAVREFLNLSVRMEGRKYAELVRWNQPRPGEWGIGSKDDQGWWRSHNGAALKKFRHWLSRTANRQRYNQILEQLRWNR